MLKRFSTQKESERKAIGRENGPVRIQLLVVQSTQFCNIDCSYCYLPNRMVKGRMSDQVISDIANNIVSSKYFDSNSLVLWHAGEPLSVPSSWYRDVYVKFANIKDGPVRFQFQTNGMLIDESWAEFFAETRSCVGLSIDGPEFVHDHYRKDRQGRGTLDQTLRSVGLLKKYNIPFTIISTITNHSLPYVDEIYDVIQHLRPEKWGLSIEEAEGANASSTIYNSSALEGIEQFFFRVASRNFSSESPIRIREIETVLLSLNTRPRSDRRPLLGNQENRLGSIVSVGIDGSVSFFSPEMLTSLQTRNSGGVVGNITESSLEELLLSEHTKHLHEKINIGVEACKSDCDYFEFCGGGSPANKFAEHGRYDVSDTWQCILSKKAATRGILAAIGTV